MNFLMYLGLTFWFFMPNVVRAQSTFQAEKESFETLKNNVNNRWQSRKSIQETSWKDYQSKILQKWRDGQMPTVKTYVEYSDDVLTRIRIDFDRGHVHLETVSPQKLSTDTITERFQKMILSNTQLLEDQIPLIKEILGENGSIKIKSFIDASSKVTVTGKDGTSRILYAVNLPMTPKHVKMRAQKYLPSILLWAGRYSIPPALILAIIWQESSFNPMARSHIPAYGLMQIVPRFAGSDVKKLLNEVGNIDGEFLYDSENNLRYGATYLKILSENSFKRIEPFESRVPFIIAGYNWGPNRLLKLIKNGKIKLTTPKEIKDQIYKAAPAETKDYLIKVIDRWKKIEQEKWI